MKEFIEFLMENDVVVNVEISVSDTSDPNFEVADSDSAVAINNSMDVSSEPDSVEEESEVQNDASEENADEEDDTSSTKSHEEETSSTEDEAEEDFKELFNV